MGSWNAASLTEFDSLTEIDRLTGKDEGVSIHDVDASKGRYMAMLGNRMYHQNNSGSVVLKWRTVIFLVVACRRVKRRFLRGLRERDSRMSTILRRWMREDADEMEDLKQKKRRALTHTACASLEIAGRLAELDTTTVLQRKAALMTYYTERLHEAVKHAPSPVYDVIIDAILPKGRLGMSLCLAKVRVQLAKLRAQWATARCNLMLGEDGRCEVGRVPSVSWQKYTACTGWTNLLVNYAPPVANCIKQYAGQAATAVAEQNEWQRKDARIRVAFCATPHLSERGSPRKLRSTSAFSRSPSLSSAGPSEPASPMKNSFRRSFQRSSEDSFEHAQSGLLTPPSPLSPLSPQSPRLGQSNGSPRSGRYSSARVPPKAWSGSDSPRRSSWASPRRRSVANYP